MMYLYMVLHSIEHMLIFKSCSLSLFVMGCSLDHLSLVVLWVYISIYISDLICEPFESIPLLVICMFLEWQDFGESFMRSFASWIWVDIHSVWGLSNLSLGSPDHYLHCHSIIGDMTFLTYTYMSWTSFFVPFYYFSSFPIISFHTGHSIFIPFLYWYTSLIYYLLHRMLHWLLDNFFFLFSFIIDTYIDCFKVHWLTRLFCTLHLIHQGIGFDHWVLELSFLSFLSPYYPKHTLWSMS